MKRIAAIALFATATLMTAGNASAQSAVLKVDVPFNFTVNSTSLPAGIYTVCFDTMLPDWVVIQDQAKNVRARFWVLRGPFRPGREDRLIFHGYGGEVFLSEVHFDSTWNGVFLPETKLERQARASRREELASIAGH
jgi:hypothetical protein